MLRVLSLLCLLAPGQAWPTGPPGWVDAVKHVASAATHALPFHASADPCTGEADPAKSAPYCYEGKATVLGAITEDVMLHIKQYGNNAGSLDISVKGAVDESCKDVQFKKSGQDIAFDSSCLKAQVTAKYCSDQDYVAVNVQVSGMPAVAATLKSVTCP